MYAIDWIIYNQLYGEKLRNLHPSNFISIQHDNVIYTMDTYILPSSFGIIEQHNEASIAESVKNAATSCVGFV